MTFSPAFALLPRFGPDLHLDPLDVDDASAIAAYLGVDLPSSSLDESVRLLAGELHEQNGFLSRELDFDTIFSSEEFRRPCFIRDVVENNRRNRLARATKPAG